MPQIFGFWFFLHPGVHVGLGGVIEGRLPGLGLFQRFQLKLDLPALLLLGKAVR